MLTHIGTANQEYITPTYKGVYALLILPIARSLKEGTGATLQLHVLLWHVVHYKLLYYMRWLVQSTTIVKHCCGIVND